MSQSYRIEFTKSARKEFLGLDSKHQAKILDSLKLLAISPYSDLLQIKKLKGEESLYRIRIGNYRLVYYIKKNELLVIVIRIGHRKDVYR